MKLSEVKDRIIDRMLDIWSDESKWAKGQLAYDDSEHEVRPESNYAVRWCAIGCARRAWHDLGLYEEGFNDFENFMQDYCKDRIGRSIVNYNDADETSFEDIRLIVKCMYDAEVTDTEIADRNCHCPDCDPDYAY